MAVYKPTYCYPYLEPVDLTIPDGEKYFTCQIDTSNIAITGYKIEVYDENNTLVFPHKDNKNKISPVSELPIVTNIDGLNGSELRIPFIQHFEPKITASYNAIYFKATKYVDYYREDAWDTAKEYTIGDNGQLCEKINNKPSTPVEIDGSLIFVGDTFLAKNSVYSVIASGLSNVVVELTNDDVIYVKSGDTYAGSIFQYKERKLVESTDGVWVDCDEHPLSLSNQGKTYKWQITLYSGSKGTTLEPPIIESEHPGAQDLVARTINYDTMADSEFDTLLTSGTILGSTEDRIQGPISDKIYAKQWLQLLQEPKWSQKQWEQIISGYGEHIWTNGETLYYSNGTQQYQFSKAYNYWFTPAWMSTFTGYGYDIWKSGTDVYYSHGESHLKLNTTTSEPKWDEQTWKGLTDFDGRNIWTSDGEIYYSCGADQYQLDKTISTWNEKIWNGLTNIYGSNIWTDGTHIYYSAGTIQYQLDKSTSTWSQKTWSGLTNFYGQNIWADEKHNEIYYSNSTQQYKLGTSSWYEKTWGGIAQIDGYRVWTDGENIYYSNPGQQYQLDTANATWNVKQWKTDYNFQWEQIKSFDNLYGSSIWTDGENVYYSSRETQYWLDPNDLVWKNKHWSNLPVDIQSQHIWVSGDAVYYSFGTQQYQLDKINSAWVPQTWNGLTNFSGSYVWTDGKNIYYSCDEKQYQLNLSDFRWSEKTWSGLTPVWGSEVWTVNGNVYYSDGKQQYQLDKDAYTWKEKTWNGLTEFQGSQIWIDDKNIVYCFKGTDQYTLDTIFSTWRRKTWLGFSPSKRSNIWTDGTTMFYSDGSSSAREQYKLGDYSQVGTRTYIESYSQSLGHIYPISGDSRGFGNDDIYGVNPATHFAVYKYSNDPEHMTSQNSVDQSINFALKQYGATYTQGNYSYEVEGADDIKKFNNKCKELNTTPLCNYKHDEKQDSYTADYSGQSVLIWNEHNSKANPLTGYFTINFTTSSGVDGENTPKFTFLMAYAYRKVSSYIGKVFFVKDGSFTNQNIVSKAEATGDNNILSLGTPLTFIEEEPLEIYPNEVDKFHGEIFKNSAGKVYVSPFVGLQPGARLYVFDGTVIKATDVDTTHWAVTYNPASPASTAPYSSINPLKYEIRTNFKSSDETPFYAYDSPRLVPWVLENLAVANEHGHEFLLESGGEILTVPILCSQKVDRRYIEVGGQYLQAQNKSWTSYRWLLVDAYGNIIQDTGKQYDGAIRTTFYGLDGPTKKAVEDHEAIPNVYYIVLIVEDELGNVLLMGIKIEVTIDPTDLIAQFSGEFDCKTHSVKLGIQDYGYPALSKDKDNTAIKLGDADGVVTQEGVPSYVGLQGVDKGQDADGNSTITPSWKATSKMALPLEGAQLKRFFKYKVNQIADITQTPSKMVANKEGNIEFHTQVELDANFCGDIFTYVVDIGDRFGNTDKLRISLALPENFLTSQGGDKV